ncbi:hypothetical protein [Sphingobium sp. YR768]|uniref:hypothetical protein n=1 Tax=Sphingobium sp. YR768 TaxID=1884365 RepID=UPI0008BAC464|nr:hypothetical protein [Sphingobium sp. YR768]SER94054.1 hypothetical protein SAMN05518866_1262 [Sphingobium sp. YR768]
MIDQTMIERVTLADKVAAEAIGGHMASWHEFNRRGDYEQGCVEAARHRIRSIAAMSSWQPIETAPLDMTEVLVLIRPKVIRLGWYFAPSSRTKGWRDENNRPINPTHWMPLPALPAIDAALKGEG